MGKFSAYEYRKQPGFDMNAFAGANQAIPMKTLVIYCFDPRAVEIPEAVAAYFGDEVYPGEIITDENGIRVGSTRTLFTATNAGGRAAFALESVRPWIICLMSKMSLSFTTRSAVRRPLRRS
jgi:carbonic anhydrase